MALSALAACLLLAGCGNAPSNGGGLPEGDQGEAFSASAVALSSDSIRIDWTASPGAEAYWVMYSEEENPDAGGLRLAYPGSVADRSYVLTGLEPDTVYYFRVYPNDQLAGEYAAASARTLAQPAPVGNGMTLYNNSVYDDDPITAFAVFDATGSVVGEYAAGEIGAGKTFAIADVPNGTYRVMVEDAYASGKSFASTLFDVDEGTWPLVTYTGDGIVVTGGIPASDIQGIYETTADLGAGAADYDAFLASNGTYFVERPDDGRVVVELGSYSVDGDAVTFSPTEVWRGGLDGERVQASPDDAHEGAYDASRQVMTARGAAWGKFQQPQ
jgi:hypothetical protein